ncbi:MAG: bifunctional riboflavin kinase/FAD synthetase [Acholeplasmataceae bacterium]|nr:bifunctional riboflavin kinase/FAD synthetase [Acholeplasmataceae bacterium]
MQIVHASHKYIKNKEPITLTMGNFDGLHLGHQQLIERVLGYTDTKHAVLTLDPHPSTVLRKQQFKTLTQKADKIELLTKYKLDYLFIIHFDAEFSQFSVPQFISFLKSIAVKRIVVGRDARFGYRGMGTVMDLRKYFHVIIVDDMLYNHTRVSTTYIKDLLSEGELGTARKLLNRHYGIRGIVVHGNNVGKQLGFPTANIDFGNYYVPKNGVYYVKVCIDNHWHHAMANIGNNPTINFTFERRLEVYILDFNQSIYGKIIEVDFLHYLRPEIKFKDRKALIEQLKNDEQAVRKLTI